MRPTSAAPYDLVVIGSGPAGEKGAAQAAYFRRRVALVEQAPQLGGAGINTGTVPSKTLRETALYFSGLRQRGLYGIDYTIKKDLTVSDFMYRRAACRRRSSGIWSAPTSSGTPSIWCRGRRASTTRTPCACAPPLAPTECFAAT